MSRSLQWLRRLLAIPLLLLSVPGVVASADDALELMREGGKVLLVRHASTVPGLGDPPGFRLGDCTTQRNLSESGREESGRLGARLREAGVPIAEVRSSEWCRCVDTAELAFAGHGVSVMVWPPLNSFFRGQGDAQAQTTAARAALSNLPKDSNWVWVTHQVNITALTGVVPAMGEVVVAAPGPDGLQVLARWRP
jgi:broad specificity phosphatase PhoE